MQIPFWWRYFCPSWNFFFVVHSKNQLRERPNFPKREEVDPLIKNSRRIFKASSSLAVLRYCIMFRWDRLGNNLTSSSSSLISIWKRHSALYIWSQCFQKSGHIFQLRNLWPIFPWIIVFIRIMTISNVCKCQRGANYCLQWPQQAYCNCT